MEGRRLLIALPKLEHQGGSELMSPISHIVRSTIIRPGITGLRVGDVYADDLRLLREPVIIMHHGQRVSEVQS